MRRKRIVAVRARIEALRQSGAVRPAELQRLARTLGRTLVPRGKHPTWVNRSLPALPPLSIPDHGGGKLNRFTAMAILDQLDEDLRALERLSGEDEAWKQPTT